MRAISALSAAALATTCCLLSGCGSAVPDSNSSCDNITITPLHDEAVKQFDLDLATKHAELATAAYCGSSSQEDDEAIVQWKCGKPCDKFEMAEVRVVTGSDKKNGGDSYAYVARTADDFTWGGGRCILAFRGTSNVAGWVNNLLSAESAGVETWAGVPCEKDGQACQVGIGWISVYGAYSEYIKGNLSEIGCGAGENAITVTGHSLGAAQASLAMLDLKSSGWEVLQTYNFGSPRVGDEIFREVFRSNFDTLPLFRITNHQDPVPHVPAIFMGYHHLNMEVYFDKGGEYQISDGTAEDLCMSDKWVVSDSTKEILKLVGYCGAGFVAGGCDHLTYMQEYTKHPMSGEACSHPSQLSASETVV